MPSAKKYQVRLTEKAEQDVDNALQWLIDQAAMTAAGKWFAELMATIDTLESMPERCGRAAEAAELERDIRELLFGKRHGKYRILFEIRQRTVHILHIRHGARDAASPSDL